MIAPVVAPVVAPVLPRAEDPLAAKSVPNVIGLLPISAAFGVKVGDAKFKGLNKELDLLSNDVAPSPLGAAPRLKPDTP